MKTFTATPAPETGGASAATRNESQLSVAYAAERTLSETSLELETDHPFEPPTFAETKALWALARS